MLIPFGSRTVKTSRLKKGVTQLKHRGRRGTRVKIYRITTRGDAVVGRKLVRVVVKRKPVPLVRLLGTRIPHPAVKPRRRCDPNYSSGCVPIASDVDCGGGSGDGPAYVYGTVKVVGVDVYGLDADGDGYGCVTIQVENEGGRHGLPVTASWRAVKTSSRCLRTVEM